MPTFLRRAAALVLCAALLVPTALASDALGSTVYDYTLDICDGTTLTREVMWSASQADLRTENYVTYTPSASISPVVSYGTSVVSKQSVAAMAQSLETGGRRVLSGINGDYFVMATGDPLGLVVTDGVLRSSASYLHALGFLPDGSAIIGTPNLDLKADFKGFSLKIADINKIRTNTGFYLFTDDFASTTRNTQAGVDVILSPDTPGGELKIGATLSCTVEEVIEATGATPIPQGKLVLSISNQSGAWLQEVIRSLAPGDSVDIRITAPDSRWNDVEYAVGGMYRILQDGAVDTSASDGAAAPRTAVGIKASGEVVFYTIDGRRSGHSVGATIQMVAQRLKELGCVDAILLDGGGSTTMVSTYPDYGSSSIINRPSEGTPRSVSNAVFLLSNLKPTGQPGSLYVTPKSLTLLPGATTQCTVTAMDTGWYPMDELPGEITWSSPEGAVSASGLFTAPQTPGVYTVTAQNGGVTGSTRIHVLQADAIYVTDEATGKRPGSYTLAPGERVNLSASGSYRSVALTGGDSLFQWTVEGDIGTITPDGQFTAGPTSATGKIRVSSGSQSVTIPVTVDAPARYTLLADFEGNAPGLTPQKAALTLDTAQVKYGTQALRVSYQDGARLALSQPLAEDERFVSLWVYGDGSGSRLAACFTTGEGTAAEQTLTDLNFTGWKQVSAAIPAGAEAFQGLALSGGSGTLWLDQLVLANQKAWDNQAPVVDLSLQGSQVTARVTDNAKDALSPDRMSLTVDGQAVPFTWKDGTLTATLSGLGESSHQITLTAGDPCGNLGRDSVMRSGTAANPFADMEGHWALPYTGRLHELGILNGVSATAFAPDRDITRGDFALMTARWLGLDLEDYAGVTLPYADAGDIPAWSENAVKALHTLGILQGSTGSDGRDYIHARASITRAQAMTILGRVLEKGYAQADLSAFSDGAAVPAWARGHVATLVELGVVGGSNGQLRPDAPVKRGEVAKMLFTLW